ncbi:MAG: patatin-like phospholipase family protein [Solirubrobacteraceae bacterium]
MTRFVLPDVLVLAGGGVVGEAWMSGVLAGVEDAAGANLREIESLVGTSAGAIVAARLAAGRSPRRPRTHGSAPAPEPASAGAVRGALREIGRWGWAAASPMAVPATALSAPAGALARAAALRAAPSTGDSLAGLARELDASGARFDGRLRVCAVDKRTGRRVVFGAPGAPRASVGEAVAASCAIPWVFAPVSIGGREYVDGGAWSVTNLDAAPARRDTQVLLLDPTAGRTGVLFAAFRVGVAVELQLLRARGARVRHVTPDAGAAAAMGSDFMARDAVRGALDAGFAQGRALARTDPG